MRWAIRDSIGSEAKWRRLIDGHGDGLLENTTRAILWTGQGPYWFAVTIRNLVYDHLPVLTRKIPLPVISVGNLTVGGTGKTPMIRWLVHWLHRQNLRVAVLSRGYKARRTTANDEFHELSRLIPEVIQIANRNRVAAARRVHNDRLADVILLDDGFQHRRLGRCLDLLVVDALQPFGHGHLLPRGTLREPISMCRRASAIALTRSDAITPQDRNRLREQFRRMAPDAIWMEAIERPVDWIRLDGVREPLSVLRGQQVAAFCGVGNPRGFEHSLVESGVQPAEWMRFPDHASYEGSQLRYLRQWARQLCPELPIACTLKDLVKLRAVDWEHVGAPPRATEAECGPPQTPARIRALHTEIEIVSGQDEWETQIRNAIRQS